MIRLLIFLQCNVDVKHCMCANYYYYQPTGHFINLQRFDWVLILDKGSDLFLSYHFVHSAVFIQGGHTSLFFWVGEGGIELQLIEPLMSSF